MPCIFPVHIQLQAVHVFLHPGYSCHKTRYYVRRRTDRVRQECRCSKGYSGRLPINEQRYQSASQFISAANGSLIPVKSGMILCLFSIRFIFSARCKEQSAEFLTCRLSGRDVLNPKALFLHSSVFATYPPSHACRGCGQCPQHGKG